MMLEFPIHVESLFTAIVVILGLAYHSGSIRREIKFFGDRIEKIELKISAITDILIKQESHTQRIDALEIRLARIEDSFSVSLASRANRSRSKAPKG